MICLTGISYVFTRTGLQDKTQALGLPAGSIQSVIALSLIVLFAILSVFLFTEMGQPPVRAIKGLTATDRDAQVARLGSSFAGWEQEAAPDRYTLFIRDPGSDARNDVGKQLVVLIGTLMTSAVGFYFGSRATVAGVAATGTGISMGAAPGTPAGQAAITGIDPAEGIPRNQQSQVTITGTGISQATNVTFTQGTVILPVAAVRRTATGLECDVTPDASAPTGAYDVAVLAGTTTVARQPGGLTVT